MGNVLTKSEFMSKYINHYYKKKFKERQLDKEGENFIIGRNANELDKKLKKRGY